MATVRVYRLDESMRPSDELHRVRSCSIERSNTDDVPLLESASIEFDADTFEPGWYRIDRLGDSHTMLGCFRFEESSRKSSNGYTTITADGYSVLKPADELELNAGAYALGGTDAPSCAASFLSVCPSSVEVDGRAALPRTIVFEGGTTALGAAWQVLDAVGWHMRIDGDGSVRIEPLPDEPALSVTDADARGLVDGISTQGVKMSYTRVDDGDYLRPGDIVTARIPRASIDAKGRICSQSLDVGASLSIDEEVELYG